MSTTFSLTVLRFQRLKMVRRLSATCAIAASLLLVAHLTAAAPSHTHTPAASSPPFVIDGHVHITNTSLFTYAWANSSQPQQACPAAPLALCNWTVGDYGAQVGASPLPASKFVFMEVDAVVEDWLGEAQWVQGLAEVQDPAGPLPLIAAIVAQPPPGCVVAFCRCRVGARLL